MRRYKVINVSNEGTMRGLEAYLDTGFQIVSAVRLSDSTIQYVISEEIKTEIKQKKGSL